MRKKTIIMGLSCLSVTIAYFLIRNISQPCDNPQEKEGYIRVYNDKPLYILFYEDKFTMREGEIFDYFGTIKETNGNIDSVNSVSINYKKGEHIIEYTVYNSNESKIYTKVLKVK